MNDFTKVLQKDFHDDFYCEHCVAEGTLRIKSVELDLETRDAKMNPRVNVYCECNKCGAEIVERFFFSYAFTEILSTEEEGEDD